MRRRRLKRRASRKNFRKNLGFRKINTARPLRGGIRL